VEEPKNESNKKKPSLQKTFLNSRKYITEATAGYAGEMAANLSIKQKKPLTKPTERRRKMQVGVAYRTKKAKEPKPGWPRPSREHPAATDHRSSK